MQTEIEAKFLHVDHHAIRERLEAMGAVCDLPRHHMKRRNYDYPDRRLDKKQNAWVRIRDEGTKVTLSYKQLQDRTLHGTKEVSIEVDDFDQAEAFLLALGLQMTSYQETRRESWRLGDTQIELDEWPWIDPFLEIEAPTEAAVREMADKLEFAWEDALHGSVEIAYQDEYAISEDAVNKLSTITFAEAAPADWPRRKK